MWKQAVAAMLLICAPWAAEAAGISFTSVREGGCKAEVHRFCEHVKPGSGRIQTCLREHHADLSKICERALKRYRNSLRFHLKMRRHLRRDPLPPSSPPHPAPTPKFRAPGP